MKLSNSFFITRREFPKDETTISTKLLIKSGMVLKNNNGIYSYLPIGLKVLNNIKDIIRKEMTDIKAIEVLLPTLSKYDEKEYYDEETYCLDDRNNNKYKLSSGALDMFSYMSSFRVKSYKDLHFSLYQINNSFRDEEKAEYGLIRKKEFCMFDGYSFDSDEGGLDVSYDKMFLAFKKIFASLSLEPVIVNGLEGQMSEEFQVVSKYGDNRIVLCPNCGYSSNIENASSKTITTTKEVEPRKMQLIKTPNKKTIKEVSEYLDVFPSNIVKSLIVKIDDVYKMVLLKGESELNVKKLEKILNATHIEIPDIYELEKIGTCAGFIGPIGCTMEIIADNEVKTMNNFICGANKKDHHYMNVNIGRDFKINRYADLKLFDENSLCPKCRSKCELFNGIEVGQITKLDKKVSKKYKLKYTDEINHEEYVQIGSYQIGLDRIIAAIVENNHDDNGIIWPMKVSPYKVAIVMTNVNDDDISKYSLNLYEKLNSLGIDTLLDDRKETVGVKFNDMDLIGIPIRITVGKKISEGIVELKLRNDENTKEIKTSKLISQIQNIIEKSY